MVAQSQLVSPHTKAQVLASQLARALDLDAMWDIALQEIVRLLNGSGGAWVWMTPVAVVHSVGDMDLPAAAWRLLSGLADKPFEQQQTSLSGLGYDIAGSISLPVNMGSWSGVLVLTRQGSPFTINDFELASAMLTIIHVTALDRLRNAQTDEVLQRSPQLSSLVAVASKMGVSLDLEEVLESIVGAVSSFLHCQRTAIFVLNPATKLLDLVAARGVSEQYWELSQNIPVIRYGRAHAVAANELVVSENVDLQPGFAEIAPLSGSEGFRAFADVPMHRAEEVIGLLSVQFTKSHHFTEDEISLLQVLAEQAAIAIENARLYTQTDEELRRRLNALESLQRVTQEITATLNLDHILNIVLSEAIKFCGAEAGLIALWSGTAANVAPMESGFELRAFYGYEDKDLTYIKELLSNPQKSPPLWHFVEQPETYYLPDVEQTLSPDYLPGTSSLLLTPVFYEKQLAAIILIQSSRPQAFAASMLEFVEGLSVQTSIAVGNARHYQLQLERGELMHQRAEQMGKLLEVSRTMRSDRPLEDMLLDVAYAIQESVGFGVVLISVLENKKLQRVAGAGIPLVDLERMKRTTVSWERVVPLFQERYRLGSCYYIPAEQAGALTAGIESFLPDGIEARKPGMWHREDVFLTLLRNSSGEVVGMMSLDMPVNGRIPTRSKAELVEIFAAQVSLIIQNNRLVEDLKSRVDTLQLFNELSRSITTKLDLQSVLDTVASAVTGLLGYDHAIIFLQDKKGRNFIPKAVSGYALKHLEGITFARGEGLVGSVGQTGMPIVIDDAYADPMLSDSAVPIGSAILVPLTVDGRAVGILEASREQTGDFFPTEVATLTALADQVSVAVENARLFDEVKSFSQELESRVHERTLELAAALEDLKLERDRTDVLYRLASELVSTLDIDRVLNQALLILRDAVKAERGSVLLADTNTGQLLIRAAIGRPDQIPPGGLVTRFSRSDGLVGWVLNNRQAVVIPDVFKDDRWVIDRSSDTCAVLAVPIMGREDNALGVVFLQSKHASAFTETELRLVEAAAVQLGNALNNAELYRLIRGQAERLGTMLRSQQIEAAKNQAILEGIADGVMVADANGRVILFNAAAERILSVSRSQALGRFLDDMLGLYGSRAREWMAQVDAWRHNPRSYQAGDFLVERLDTERGVVSIHLSPVVSPRYEFLGIVSVFRDITAIVEADRAKNEFVSTVSHELRTPMTAIKGYVDLILMGATGPLSEQQNSFLRIVKSNVDRLTNLVNDLLDISRIETGRVELHLEPVDVGPIVQQVVDTLHPKAAEKSLTLRAIVPPSLPLVYGDPSRVTQIITNLAGNSYKYTPDGGEVAVYAYVRDGVMHIAVADTGIGISEKDKLQIFERFYRVDDPGVREISGTGLGLAITFSLVQLHGGEIWVESELDKGSIFYFTLPLADNEPTVDVGIGPSTLMGDSQPAKTTILVVEDDVQIAEFLRVTLENEGYHILIAHSGEDALHMARIQLPDLISLDIRLPDLDGFEVLQLLKREPVTAGIPVVVISVVLDRERGLRLGAAEYLTKPLDEHKLLQVIDRILCKQGTVLVVDDDPETLDMMRRSLYTQGLGVHAARLGKHALELVKELDPALILLNLKLPDIDGYQVLEAIKRHKDTMDIPVIVMLDGVTGSNGKAQQLEAMGVDRFLSKPFSGEALAEEISHLVNGMVVYEE
ncbi:MAG: GAF domain-containing protein [Anaerolineae bacterium]|nr:GAF domain-containing protein [Anaerolineae bacterium]